MKELNIMKYQHIIILILQNFSEQIFSNILSPLYEEFQKQTFINRFHLVLHKRANLSKSERKLHDINDVPFLGEEENPDV